MTEVAGPIVEDLDEDFMLRYLEESRVKVESITPVEPDGPP